MHGATVTASHCTRFRIFIPLLRVDAVAGKTTRTNRHRAETDIQSAVITLCQLYYKC